MANQWQRLNDQEPELYYYSDATMLIEIVEGIKIVVDRMEENRVADGAEAAQALHFFINAINGYIQITWVDWDKQEFVGEWHYELQLRKFHDSVEDAEVYDNRCYQALETYAYRNLAGEEAPKYKVYYRFDLGGAQALFD